MRIVRITLLDNLGGSHDHEITLTAAAVRPPLTSSPFSPGAEVLETIWGPFCVPLRVDRSSFLGFVFLSFL